MIVQDQITYSCYQFQDMAGYMERELGFRSKQRLALIESRHPINQAPPLTKILAIPTIQLDKAPYIIIGNTYVCWVNGVSNQGNNHTLVCE